MIEGENRILGRCILHVIPSRLWSECVKQCLASGDVGIKVPRERRALCGSVQRRGGCGGPADTLLDHSLEEVNAGRGAPPVESESELLAVQRGVLRAP